MTSPLFAHGHLRLYLLSLLDTAPMHGYELIQALEERFGGTYVPSAGTIYPRLAKLEDEGLVTKSAEGRKTVYSITDAGRIELADREDELNSIEHNVTDSVRRLADEVRSSVNGARAEARDAGRSSRAEPQRSESGSQLRDAEIVLDEFRHNMRADLRGLSARGSMPASMATDLKSQLDAVRKALLK
jgi:DNA-binding PadR family transcriptional regulator